MGKKSQTNSKFLNKLGSISDDRLSLIAFISMGLVLLVPIYISVYAICIRSIDRIHSKHIIVMLTRVFPIIGVVAFVLYIFNLLKIKKNKQNFKDILLKNPLIIVFSLVVVLMIISQVYNGLEYALGGFMIITVGETFDAEVGYFISLLFIATQVKKESHKRNLIRINMLVSIFVVITGFIIWKSKFETPFGFYVEDVGFASIFWNTNHYGYYLSVLVPLAAAAFLYEKNMVWKVVSGLAFIGNTVALSLCNCMGAWVGAVLAMIFIIITHFIVEKIFNLQALVLFIVFAICLYLPGHFNGSFENNASELFTDIGNVVEGSEEADGAGSGRWRIYKAAMHLINENKMFGIGFEGVAYKKEEVLGVTTYNDRPHNEIMQYALFYGIPVAILYFIGCLGVYIRALKKKEVMDGATLVCLSGAFGYLVNSMFGLTAVTTAAYLFIFLGMGYVRNEETPLIEEIS